MMPSAMMLIMVISFIGGLCDGLRKNKKKYHKPKNQAINDFDPVY